LQRTKRFGERARPGQSLFKRIILMLRLYARVHSLASCDKNQSKTWIKTFFGERELFHVKFLFPRRAKNGASTFSVRKKICVWIVFRSEKNRSPFKTFFLFHSNVRYINKRC
jgi:hypothetical protein